MKNGARARGLGSETSASIVDNISRAPWSSRSGGRAGRRTWAEWRRTGVSPTHCGYSGVACRVEASSRRRSRCSRPFLPSCRRLGTAAASDLYDIEDRLGAAPACPQPPWGMSRTDGAERRGSRPVSPDLRQTGGKGRRLALSNHHERVKSRRRVG